MGATHLLWLILCLFARHAVPFFHEQKIEGRLDPEWSEYIDKIKPPDFNFDELPAERVKEKPTVLNGWSLMSKEEAPFASVIFNSAKDSKLTSIKMTQGNACGAALITDSKIITVCACLSSWTVWIHNGKRGNVAGNSHKTTPWDIKTEHIHMKTIFNPGASSTLSTSATQISYQAQCLKAITELKNPLAQQTSIVIVEIMPKIVDTYPEKYVPWPPQPIMLDETNGAAAKLLTFGMENHRPDLKYIDDFGNKIDLEHTAVNFDLNKTSMLACAAHYDDLPGDYQRHATCFVPRVDREICGGLIGSPIVRPGAIHGLLSTPVSCGTAKGEALSVVFTEEVKIIIEKVAGGERLEELNTKRPPLWREETGEKHFVSYDESLLPGAGMVLESGKPGGHSVAMAFASFLPLVLVSPIIAYEMFAMSRST